jgi:lysophospholipid acyltransferase (LPLAT)-like uncharacterized protein
MNWIQKTKFFLIRKIFKFLLLALVFSCRKKTTGWHHVLELREQGIPIIFVIWHRHISYALYPFRNSGVRPLISLSSDGELISQIATEFGTFPIRGSSSRGGNRAFLQLLRAIKTDKSEIFITADGPKGPLREIKDGTVILAQKSGSAIVPVSWTATRVKIFKKSWDHFAVPLPFSTVTFKYGEPYFIPKDFHKSMIPEIKTEIKSRLDQMEQGE